MKFRRRAFLASAVTTAALAGCLGSGETGSADTTNGTGTSNEADSDSGSTSSNGSTAVAGTAATALDHPAATALAAQPFLGPAPGMAPATIVAFEDPSCYNCRRFNENTFPAIESMLVEPGKASFVYRNFPHAFAWGEPAMQALEATFARGEEPFWALEQHYFTTQEEFSEGNVLDRTEAFLAAETAVDASAIVADAEAKAFDEAIQRDTDAGETAGVVSTPTFYLFRDGEFLTEVRGAQSYPVFAQALGVE
jgi:protein-disulfide isomerase